MVTPNQFQNQIVAAATLMVVVVTQMVAVALQRRVLVIAQRILNDGIEPNLRTFQYQA